MQTAVRDPLLDGLTEDQREAVMHDEGPLLIYADPGSGKTTVLTRRIARLIRDGLAYPSKVMAITFARAAAYEMRVRLADLIEPEQAQAVTVGTFHSVCARMLRGHAENFGRRGNYTILDQTEQEKIAARVLDAGGEPIDALIADAGTVEAKSALRRISAARNRGLDHVAGEDPLARLIQAVWVAYEAELREANCFDFDELLVCATALLEHLPGVRGFYRDRYRYVLVDEYQDTNPIQHRLLAALCAPDRNLTVVGDDDQAIYGFRQADVEHLLRFGETYPVHRTVMLVENFRSHAEILDVAHRAVAHNTIRTAKTPVARKGPGGQVHAMRFGADREEVAWVCDRVQGALAYGVAPPDIRALYPTLREGKVLQRELTARNIKHRMVGSVGIYERPEVGHALAYIKVASNACDPVAFHRAASNPSRYLGEQGMEALLGHARTHTGGDLVAAGLQIDIVQGVDPRARRPVQELCEAVEKARNEAYETRSYAHTAKELIDMPGGIRDTLETRRDSHPDGEQRHRAAQALEDLDSMVEAFIAYERRDPDDASFAGFLGEVAMDLTEEDPDIDRKRITISTYHRSKGVEADLVICTGCEEGLLPHWRTVEHGDLAALEEQRRLFYVGATRARRWLVFTHAGVRHGKPSAGRSRFLAEAGV